MRLDHKKNEVQNLLSVWEMRKMRLAKTLVGVAALSVASVALACALTAFILTVAISIQLTVPIDGDRPQTDGEETIIGSMARWANSLDPLNKRTDGVISRRQSDNAAWREEQSAGFETANIRTFGQYCLGLDSRIYVDFSSSAFGMNVARLGQEQRLFAVAASEVYSFAAIIYRERVAAAEKIENSFNLLQLFTWLSIVIGLLTTILIGLRSSKFGEAPGLLSNAIAVSSIAFPAIGTAVAAVAAFYAPREDLARSSQMLAGLRQVNTQILADLRTIKCDDKDVVLSDLNRLLPIWYRRMRDVQAIAQAATGAPQDSGRTQGLPSGPSQNPSSNQSMVPSSPINAARTD